MRIVNLKILQKYKAALIQIAINFFGKALGFLREIIISSLFGVSTITDSFFAVQQILVFFSSYMMGAFNLAFVPHYIENDKAELRYHFLSSLIYFLFSIALAANLFLLLIDEESLSGILGFKVANPLIKEFSWILSWSIFPTVLTGVAFGILHAEQRHTAATILGVASSVVMLISLLAYWVISPSEEYMKLSLPYSYLFGMLFSGLISIVVVKKRIIRKENQSKKSLMVFMKALSASSIENIGFNLNQYSNVYFSAQLGSGCVAINAYAQRIGMLPLALISSQIGQIYQSWAARKLADENKINTNILLMLTIPGIFFTILMVVYNNVIVSLIYERGSFGSEQTKLVAELLVPYSAYFFVMSVNQLVARHLFVIGKGVKYAKAMLLAYFLAFLGKLIWSVDLNGIIWSCVIAEGLVSVWFIIRIVKGEK